MLNSNPKTDGLSAKYKAEFQKEVQEVVFHKLSEVSQRYSAQISECLLKQAANDLNKVAFRFDRPVQVEKVYKCKEELAVSKIEVTREKFSKLRRQGYEKNN